MSKEIILGGAVTDTEERTYIDYQEEYLESVKAFKKTSQSLVKEYSSITIPKDNYLVRVHKFSPNVKGGKILMPDSQGNLTKAMEMVHSVLGPCAIVLKSYEGAEFKEGDLVVLPINKLRGFVDNPEWQMYETAKESKGIEAFEPEDKRKKIPFLEAVWMDNMFVRPWKYKAEDEDRLTYMLNPYDIKASWEL